MTKQERITELKELKRLAKDNLDAYKTIRVDKKKLWISKKSEISILQLKEIIQKINYDLHPDQVELYSTLQTKFKDGNLASDEMIKLFNVNMTQTQFGSTIFDIARLSPDSNILLDIAWLTDGNISDYLEIYLKRKDISILEKFLPSKIIEIQTRIIPLMQADNRYNDIVSVIDAAIESSNKNNYISSSMLLITACESLVRILASGIYKHQNSDSNEEAIFYEIYQKHNSLENLIKKGIWIDDYPLKFSEALVKYKDVNAASLNAVRVKYQKHSTAIKSIERKLKRIIELSDETELISYIEDLKSLSDELMKDEDKDVKINLTVMLDFLVRKYKDDRNQIIHGNFKGYDLRWKNYINFAAIVKIFDVFAEYEKFYDTIKSRS